MQSNTLAALLDAEIPDPTDFDDPALRQLDTAIRCTICSEWYEAPVTLTCGHGFCSLCARKHINDKSECPSCRQPMNEGGIRVATGMEEVVSAWKLARPIILQLLKNEKSRVAKLECESRTLKSARTTKKRKLSHGSEWDIGPSSDGIECIAGPSNIPLRRSPSDATVSTNNGGEDDDVGLLTTSASNFNSMGELIEEELPKGFVKCPICSTRVKEQAINAHIDNGCQSPAPISANSKGKAMAKKKPASDTKNEWFKLLAPKRDSPAPSKGSAKGQGKGRPVDPEERLPKVTYTVLKDRQLKDLLSNFGLSTSGNRAALINRHTRYLMTYNANLDKSTAQRKSVATLRAELQHWEDQQVLYEKKREKEKEGGGPMAEDATKYQLKNKSEFDKLVKAARGSSAKHKLLAVPNSAVKLRGPMIDDDVVIVDSEEGGG